MRVARAFFLLVAIFAVMLPSRQASSQEPVVTCRVCSNQGSHPCSKHKKALAIEQEASGTLFCSEVIACKNCAGVLATDCKTCGNEPVEAALARRKKLVADWLVERRATVDAVADNKPLMHLRTPHCELVFSVRPLTVGRKKLSTHALMHLYGQRIEALRALFLTTFELEDKDLPGTLQIYMFGDPRDHMRVGARVTGLGVTASNGCKLMGVPCIYSLWQDKRTMPDDEALHRTVVHNVSHLLLSNMVVSNWLGNRKLGWVDAGVAHWFEDRITGKCANFCFEEVLLKPGAGFKGGKWRVPVRKLVDSNDAVSFAELSKRNTDQLSFEEHAIAFAHVDYLLAAHGGAKFRDFLRVLKDGTATRDALQSVYGQNPLTIDGTFRQWVKDNYSLR